MSREPEYSDVIAKVAPAKRGSVEVVQDTPTEFDRLRGMMDGMPLYREKYVRLLVNGVPMMTDAEFERRTNRVPVSKAKGDALVAGGGIGIRQRGECVERRTYRPIRDV